VDTKPESRQWTIANMEISFGQREMPTIAGIWRCLSVRSLVHAATASHESWQMSRRSVPLAQNLAVIEGN
jgi:hypothetical protein